MAELKLYTPEEVAERSRPKREQKRAARESAIEEYLGHFLNAGPGFAGEVHLDEGEDKRTLRNILKQAAERANLRLRFRPIKNQRRIEFSVEARQQQQAAQTPPEEGRTRARGGNHD